MSDHLRILVIDDNEEYAQSLKVTLPYFDPSVEVEICGTARAGLERLSRLDQPVDCILLDLILPCGKGGELMERIFRGAMGVPVVVVSAYTDPELETMLIRLGAQDVLDKLDTADPKVVLRAVRNAITRHQVRIEYEDKSRESLSAAWKTSEELKRLMERQLSVAS